MGLTKIRLDQFADSTRVISGSGASINSGNNTKFDFNIVGEIFNPTTKVLTPININLVAQTVTNLAQKITYIGVTTSGTILQQSTRFTSQQKYSHLTEWVLIHTNGTNLNAVNNYPNSADATATQLHNFMRTIGTINDAGNVYSTNGANVKLNKTSGVLVGVGFGNLTADAPNRITTASGTAFTFRIRNQNGTETADVTDVDTTNYDLGGITTALPGGAASNNWQIYRFYLFTSNLTRAQRGQFVYGSMAEAEANLQSESYIVEQNNLDNGTLRGYLIVRKGTTDLTDTSRAKFIEANKFGNAPAGGGLVPTLQSTYNVSTSPEIITDATRGALSIQCGSGSDVDLVFETKNTVATNKVTIAGNGTTIIGTGTPSFTGLFNIVDTVAGSTGVLSTMTNLSTTGLTALALTESTNRRLSFGRFNQSYVGNVTGTTIAYADSAVMFSMTSGVVGDGKLILHGAPIYGLVGSTGTNLGFKQDAVGFRIDQINNLQSANTIAFQIGTGLQFNNTNMGIATAPVTNQPITTSMSLNGQLTSRFINSSTGTASVSTVVVQNSASSNFGLYKYSTGYTTSGLLTAGLSSLISSAGDTLYANSATASHIWSISGTALVNEYMRLSPSGLSVNGGVTASSINLITQTINNGSTLTAPSEDAVFDALALRPTSTRVFSCSGHSPADSTTYFIGDYTAAVPQTTANVSMFTFATSRTIKEVLISTRCAVVGSSESVQFYIRQNNTTDFAITTTHTIDSAAKSIVYSGLNIAVTAGTTYEIKIITPAWVTNPTNVIYTVTLILY